MYGHIKKTKNRIEFLAFCRYLRSLYPPEVRIAIVLDNLSPHLSTKSDSRVGDWAEANNVEFAYVPTNASFLNRIECHFTALRYFALNGTDHQSHEERNSMIRRYIAWRNRHKDDEALRAISLHAKVVRAGQAVHARSGEQVRYSTPCGARYVSVCVPAFSPETVQHALH
jgi:hypothetical protein